MTEILVAMLEDRKSKSNSILAFLIMQLGGMASDLVNYELKVWKTAKAQ